jgi:hypothetical protein
MADPLELTAPLKVYGGDTWAPPPWQRGYLTDPEDAATFVPYDYSTWTEWRAQWRPDAESSTVIELTVHHDDAATGTFGVSATPEQTREMGDSGVFDVQVSNGPDDVVTLLLGATSYKGDVTRD